MQLKVNLVLQSWNFRKKLFCEDDMQVPVMSSCSVAAILKDGYHFAYRKFLSYGSLKFLLFLPKRKKILFASAYMEYDIDGNSFFFFSCSSCILESYPSINICFVLLLLYVLVNSYVHVGTVASDFVQWK